MNEIILYTDIPRFKFVKRGKVRDIYEFEDKLVIVSTDRISAFDFVFPNGIPHKGKILNLISAFWFSKLKHIIPNHFITIDIDSILKDDITQYEKLLIDRTMIVYKAQPIPIEAIVRGYLAGSAFNDYKKNGKICGINLPEGLIESSKLEEPVFTPSTKVVSGHDENITEREAADIIGYELIRKIKETSIRLYNEMSEYCQRSGIILADTKFEFGLMNDELLLIDEVGTPDSSRYWDPNTYIPGKSQPSFDKQYVRDYLQSIGWNKQPPIPELPEFVVRETSNKYQKAYELIIGKEFQY